MLLIKGFTGDDCSQNIDECASTPCMNKATCIDKANAYECECAPGNLSLINFQYYLMESRLIH